MTRGRRSDSAQKAPRLVATVVESAVAIFVALVSEVQFRDGLLITLYLHHRFQ